MQYIDLHRQYEYAKEKIDARIKRVIERGAFIGGGEVKELSAQLAEYCGAKFCLTCANGTDALTLALRCFGVRKGDAVFVPDFTFFASAEVAALEGAMCVFVDIDKRTFNIDPEKLEEAILRVRKEKKLTPKCIVAVDLYGLPADYDKIKKISEKYGLPIVEDAAQGFGGSIRGKKACSFGDIAATSFFPAKPLGCYGDGGAVFTDNVDYHALMSSLAVHGKGSFKYDNVRIGYNSRLDTIQAAILLEKLELFRAFELKKRNEIAEKYTALLKDKFLTPFVPDGFVSSWAQYTLILDSKEEREKIQEALKGKGIPSMVYYPIPMHKQKAFYYAAEQKDLEISSKTADTVLSIPMHPYLKEEEIEFVCKNLNSLR